MSSVKDNNGPAGGGLTAALFELPSVTLSPREKVVLTLSAWLYQVGELVFQSVPSVDASTTASGVAGTGPRLKIRSAACAFNPNDTAATAANSVAVTALFFFM